MSHQLAFSHLESYDPGLPGITVPAKLSLGALFTDCEVKIDTGSTDCIFAKQLADNLGIRLETGFRQFIGTATGVFAVRRHEVRLSVVGYEFEILACFAEDESFPRNVLGRHGFLERVRLGLVDYEGLLYVSDYNEQNTSRK